MKKGDLVKWTEETGEIYFGIVTCMDEHYVEVNWTDGDSGYYSVFAPFIMAFFDIPVTIEAQKLGIFKFLGIGADKWKNLEGFVLLPEVRQGMLALLGFYFGSSQVK